MAKIKVAMLQSHVYTDKEENLRALHRKLEELVPEKPDLVTLPEMFNCPYENACFPRYGEPAGGESWQFLSGIAKELGVYLIGGSVPELEGGKIYNTSYIFSPEGKELARHRKVHLFDIDVPGGQRFMESDTLTAGDSFTVVDTAYGKIGVAICFDIRFSDFFRVMGDMGAQLIVIPAAFNMTTGPIHWDLAFRMRALDNQCFIAGCSPARDVNASYVAYGHSLVCNPWGDIIAQLDEKEGVRVVDIDLDDLAKYRGQIPILAGRRTDMYRTEKLK